MLLTVGGTYTYQKAQDFTDPEETYTYGGQIAYIPWHSASATANLQWNIGSGKQKSGSGNQRGGVLSVNYAFIYVGERYHNSANIPENYEQPWHTHDLSMSYEFDCCKPGDGSKKHKCSPRLYFALEINNMFNQQYEIINNYPMPGINGKGIVRIKL